MASVLNVVGFLPHGMATLYTGQPTVSATSQVASWQGPYQRLVGQFCL